MKSKLTVGSSASRWPSNLGRVGGEYAAVIEPQPRLLIWIRQSADSDKRERLSQQFRRTHAHLERLTIRSLSGVFDPLTQKILDRFEQAGTVAVQVGELFHQAELAIPFNHAMKPAWMRAAEAGIHFEADWAGAVKPQFYVPKHVQRELPSIDVEMSAGLQNAVREWLKARTEGVWSEVAKTIHSRLETTLRNGLRDGRTLKEMTADIQSTLKGVEEYQAKRIARTETTGGMNFGGQAERTDLGITHKEWVSTIDRRTRGTGRKDRYDHISVNGQIVNNTDPFSVSGQRLMYPADGSLGAGAGNICNCRCCSVGAWPHSPLKPNADKLPVVKAAGWIEPKYERTEIPTIKLPRREMPSRTASVDEQKQYANLRGMDAEQRSQTTTDRINLVRDKLTAANDNLETIRQRVIARGDKVKSLDQQAKIALNDVDNAVLAKMPQEKIEQLKALKETAEKQLDAAKLSVRNDFAKDIATPSKPDISVATELGDRYPIMTQRAEDAATWLSSVVSDKHGKSLTLNIAKSPNDGSCYSPAVKKLFMSPLDQTNVYLHEAGHFIENCGNALVESLCKGFLHHRGKIEMAERIGRRKIFEVGVGDDWEKTFGAYGGKYVGRYYPGATEILSMGIQMLYDDPLGFAIKDPEYFKFIIGILRGDFL